MLVLKYIPVKIASHICGIPSGPVRLSAGVAGTMFLPFSQSAADRTGDRPRPNNIEAEHCRERLCFHDQPAAQQIAHLAVRDCPDHRLAVPIERRVLSNKYRTRPCKRSNVPAHSLLD